MFATVATSIRQEKNPDNINYGKGCTVALVTRLTNCLIAPNTVILSPCYF